MVTIFFEVLYSLTTYLKAGVAAMMIGVFERGKNTAFVLDIRVGVITLEYWTHSRAMKGKSPASNNDRDGMM